MLATITTIDEAVTPPAEELDVLAEAEANESPSQDRAAEEESSQRAVRTKDSMRSKIMLAAGKGLQT